MINLVQLTLFMDLPHPFQKVTICGGFPWNFMTLLFHGTRKKWLEKVIFFQGQLVATVYL